MRYQSSSFFLVVVFFSLQSPAFSELTPPLQRPPNVLLIMTDDQGWGDLRSHGNSKIDTPVLDRLAFEGARFDRFFVSPVCAPTRASLLTGRYHLRTGVHGVTRARETMRSDETTLAEIFRAGGYTTGCFGKWHNGAHYPHHPNGQGFDEFFGFCAGHWNNYFDTHLEHNGRQVKTKGYITDILTQKALSFIEQNKDRPFFCYVPYNAPHSPWQVPDKYFDKYKARGLDDKTACAYAMCENLDENMGKLLNSLDRLQLSENTIVLFLTDNGPNSDRYNGEMRGRKGSVDEGGIRVPLFIRWPGHIRPGTRIKQIAAHIDLLPSLVQLCHVPMIPTKPLDGKSLAGLLLGTEKNWPDRMIFTHRLSQQRASVRTQRWRLTRQKNHWRLNDMSVDPSQKKDVSEEFPEVVSRLSAASESIYKEMLALGIHAIPTHLGHPQRPTVILPGHEANLLPQQGKGISYVGRSGWANDWITNWTSIEAYPRWDLKVVRQGNYQVTLHYSCPKKDLGSKIRVEVGDRFIEATITHLHDPSYLSSPDRVRRGEVYEKEWAQLPLGVLQLEKGLVQLSVKALSKAGRRIVDLKSVELEYLD